MAITPQSQVDNEESIIQKFFGALSGHLKKIAQNTEQTRVIVDEYRSEPGASGQVILDDQVKGPFVLTDIIAAWATTNAPTSASITIADRVIPLVPGSGVYTLSLTTGMQVDNHQNIRFQVTPANVCFFEIQGYSDQRVAQ